MSITTRLRAAWSAIMDVTGEQIDVAAPNTAAIIDPPAECTIESVHDEMKAALADFTSKVDAHNVAKAIVDEAAKVVYGLTCKRDAVRARLEQTESDLSPVLAKAEDWLTKAL